MFYYEWYRDHAQYPGDVVGYWAEGRVLGGVVLFDRRASRDPDAVFLHADREDVPHRICKLTDAQKARLLGFLQSPEDTDEKDCPLPLTPGEETTVRLDPEEPFDLTGAYRDEWERKLGDLRCRDVYDSSNYLGNEEFYEAGHRWRTRYERWEGYDWDCS